MNAATPIVKISGTAATRVNNPSTTSTEQTNSAIAAPIRLILFPSSSGSANWSYFPAMTICALPHPCAAAMYPPIPSRRTSRPSDAATSRHVAFIGALLEETSPAACRTAKYSRASAFAACPPASNQARTSGPLHHPQKTTSARPPGRADARHGLSPSLSLRAPGRERRLEADEVVHVQHRRHRAPVAVRRLIPRRELRLEADEVI